MANSGDDEGNSPKEYLYALLEAIREKPGMFLAKASLRNLDSFLYGYKTARLDLGIPATPQEIEFYSFSDWVAKKYKQSSSTEGWANIILAHSQDEAEAFAKFWELFDRFVIATKKKAAKQKV